MRKGNLINLMVGAAMLLTMSFGLSSCEDILGEWDKPAPFHVNVDGTNEVTITKTETGATVTVNTPSDITNFLSQVKDDITAKGTEEYVFDIACSGVKSSSGDNTITVPKVDGSNINLKFEQGVNTESPLVIKAAETASATPTTAVNTLTITMPDGTTGLNLVIDMPETSVTVKTVSGSVVYEGIVANTALNTLILESGVTVKTLLWKGGNITVKEGAAIETIAVETNEGDALWAYTGFANLYKADADYYYFISNQGNQFDNYKILKGTSESMEASFNLWNYNDNKLSGKVTIADGVTIKPNQFSVKEIEGEGTAKVTLSGWAQNYSWMENEKEVYPLYCDLNIEKIRGIIFTAPINTNSNVVESDNVIFRTNLDDVPTNIENCTFNFDQVSFATAKETTGSAKNCIFLGSKGNNSVSIYAPIQSAEIPSCTFTFSNCTFSEGCYIYPNVEQKKYEYDSEGNPVYYNNPCYEYWMDGRWYVVESLDDVPKGATEVYTREYDIQKYTYVEFNNYDVIVAFEGCKLGNANLNSESECFGMPWNQVDGLVFRYKIDGTLYKVEWDGEKGKYVLIPA